MPVNALLALASGGYALEEIGADGVHHLVAVEVLGSSTTPTASCRCAAPVSPPVSASWCRANERRARARGGDQVYSGSAAGHGAGRGELQRSPRRAGCDRRAVRFGEVDLAAPDGHPRSPSSGTVRLTGLDVGAHDDRELSALRATRIGSRSPGVSSVTFHGIGLRHIGIPSIDCSAVAAARAEDDHVVLRVQIRCPSRRPAC